MGWGCETGYPGNHHRKSLRINSEEEFKKRKLKLFFANIFWTIVIFLVANAFVGLYLTIKYLLNPQGFWQNLVLFGLGIYVMGFFQLIFWVAGIVLIFKIWIGKA